MATLKVTSWNVEHMHRLFEANGGTATRRRANVAREIRDLDPDVLCLLEGPRDEPGDPLGAFCAQDLGGDWQPVRPADGDFGLQGNQWIWFLVKRALAPHASLLPVATWKSFAGASWPVSYWGDFESTLHRHFRHPQTLVLDRDGVRVEFIGLHLKSKFVQRGRSRWEAGGTERQQFIREAIKARIKLTTEAANVRTYLDRKFHQAPNPAVFVMGDLNDGPGKEFFEDQFLFFDLLSNIQGEVFFARRFLNHALFDFDDELRWTVQFEDFVQPERDPRILLDHILFTQGLVDGSLPLEVKAGAGRVEHEVHELVNAAQPASARTSDHRPVSVLVQAA
jgi:endonuclease/exonuclease/phosphatase family metal-dependent hydrolase